MVVRERRPAVDRRSRRGFTLVEFGVAGSLAAFVLVLTLPALQQARETARGTTCRSNLKQLGLALHAYHDAAGQFPPGAIWPRFQHDNPRTNYFPHLFAWLGLSTLADRIDWNVSDTLWCRGNNVDVVATPIPLLLCPSDGLGGRTKRNPYCGEHALTNYMALFGDRIADVYTTKAIFGANRGASHTDIRDGSSNTLIMAEYLTGTPDDLRGGLWGDEAGMSLLFTGLPPNSTEPDLVYPNPVLCDPGDPVTNNPALNLPCDLGDGYSIDTAAARSRHPGGVHALLADGSVRFVSETIAPSTWRSLGAIADQLPPTEH